MSFQFQYLSLFIFFCISTALALVLYALSYSLVYQKPDLEKSSAYECGFVPFDDARQQFDVRFYLVSILFIIFDLEVSYLFPWAIYLKNLNLLGFYTMTVFLVILTVGFVYEWKKGALEWE